MQGLGSAWARSQPALNILSAFLPGPGQPCYAGCGSMAGLGVTSFLVPMFPPLLWVSGEMVSLTLLKIIFEKPHVI